MSIGNERAHTQTHALSLILRCDNIYKLFIASFCISYTARAAECVKERLSHHENNHIRRRMGKYNKVAHQSKEVAEHESDTLSLFEPMNEVYSLDPIHT